MDNGLNFKHRLPPAALVANRVAWLCEYCSGKKVLHIGCVDTGMLEQRIEKGDFLHTRLEEKCSGLIGVDVDSKGLAAMERLGFTNLLEADVSNSSSEVIRMTKEIIGDCDMIVCGEVLEHVLDKGSFLAGLREISEAFDATLIVTVPNAFAIRWIVGVIAGKEWVHPDHKCYFSSITLDTLLQQTGFSVRQTLFYSNETAPLSARTRLLKAMFNKSVFRLRPHLAEGLIMTAKAR